jgi:hypothetical protein
MNYQIIPGFEDIRIGYVIKKRKNKLKTKQNKTKTRTECLCIEKKRQTNKQKTNKKQTALYIILISTTSHITHNNTPHGKKN